MSSLICLLWASSFHNQECFLFISIKSSMNRVKSPVFNSKLEPWKLWLFILRTRYLWEKMFRGKVLMEVDFKTLAWILRAWFLISLKPVHGHLKMSINIRMDKEDVVHTMDGPRYYHTTWSKTKTNITWYHLYVKSTKDDTNEHI